MDARAAIQIKRDGGALSPVQIRSLIRAYTAGEIPDYQMAAWLMAVCCRGLDPDETRALTEAMLHSGEVLDLSSLPGPIVDKHSTGGVGDKISIPLAPIVAVCGGYVPMISGRGLGHTGGTLDKLEAIPGFRTGLSPREFRDQVEDLGMAFGSQTSEFAPADQMMYALRDVTSTVESVPLIVASILSKKLASGAERVVFDVKTGTGAFMFELDSARELAEALVETIQSLGRRGTALITRMDDPLGVTVGNALEIRESVAILRGEGPPDTTELTSRLAAEMLVLADQVGTREEGEARSRAAIADGSALERLRRVVERQGGDPRTLDDLDRLPHTESVREVTAGRSGHVLSINSRALGDAVGELGGGRKVLTDAVDPAVGLEVLVRTGDAVESDTPILRVHARRPDDRLDAKLRDAFAVGKERVSPRPLVLEAVGGASEAANPSSRA